MKCRWLGSWVETGTTAPVGVLTLARQVSGEARPKVCATRVADNTAADTAEVTAAVTASDTAEDTAADTACDKGTQSCTAIATARHPVSCLVRSSRHLSRLDLTSGRKAGFYVTLFCDQKAGLKRFKRLLHPEKRACGAARHF